MALVAFICSIFAAGLLHNVHGLKVQHSFGDGQFAVLGEIEGLSYTRNGWDVYFPKLITKPLNEDQKNKLSQLIADDGQVTLKLQSETKDPSNFVECSVPARCLADQEANKKLVLHADFEGKVVGMYYDAHLTACEQSSTADLLGEVPVQLDVPVAAPRVIHTGMDQDQFMGRGKPGGKQDKQQPKEQQQQQQLFADGTGAAAPGQEGGAQQPPPPPQTWWQKNWWLLAILFALGLQVLKAQLEPQTEELRRQQMEMQRTGGGGGASGGGAPAGGARQSSGQSRRR